MYYFYITDRGGLISIVESIEIRRESDKRYMFSQLLSTWRSNFKQGGFFLVN